MDDLEDDSTDDDLNGGGGDDAFATFKIAGGRSLRAASPAASQASQGAAYAPSPGGAAAALLQLPTHPARTQGQLLAQQVQSNLSALVLGAAAQGVSLASSFAHFDCEPAGLL